MMIQLRGGISINSEHVESINVNGQILSITMSSGAVHNVSTSVFAKRDEIVNAINDRRFNT